MKNKPAPLLNPGTGQPMGYDDLRPVFCGRTDPPGAGQRHREIPIPDEDPGLLQTYRPAPLVRAYNLEKKLGTPAKIYYKFEGNNTSGSHKLNSAIAQAYYAKQQGLKGVTTETGAGQWGTALSMALRLSGSGLQGLYGEVLLRAEALPPGGHAGVRRLGDALPPPRRLRWAAASWPNHPGTTGSLGCAISEAVEVATSTPRLTAMCWAVCSTRCCCTRASSAWRPRPPWTNTASSRTSSSAARAAAATWAD